MKKTFFFTLCLSAFITLSASAKIWRVNNNPGVNADFTTIQAAHDDVNVMINDTLHVEPSLASYGALTITKKLVILGNGYFLSENTLNQSNIFQSIIDGIDFYPGSENSVVSGLTMYNLTFYSGNVTLKRNRIIEDISFLANTNSFSNILIENNYIYRGIVYGTDLIHVVSGIYILNNRIGTCICGNQGSGWSITFGKLFSGIIANNVFDGTSGLSVSNFNIKNNIFLNGSIWNPENGSPPYNNSNTVKNNIFNGTVSLNPGDLTSGNQFGVNMANVFVGLAGNSSDGQYHLLASSPAIGAGLNGEDCGMFGGASPYKLSGLPAIPSVYLLNAPAITNTITLPVTISVKSNN